MTIEITSYERKDYVITLEAENCDELNLMRLERQRDDYTQRMVYFVFDLRERCDQEYLRGLLKRQKAVKNQECRTWDSAGNAIVGTRIQIDKRWQEYLD